jgi:hypothetical protein
LERLAPGLCPEGLPTPFFGEVNMFRIEAPILIVPTCEALVALGPHLRPAALAAYREIALAAKGLEIAHLQFVFGKLTLAVCSRVRRDGICQTASNGDPGSASNRDPTAALGEACPGSE